MFEHADDAEISVFNVNKEDGVCSDDIIEVDDNEESLGQENTMLENTFINPSQDDKISSDEMHQCTMCDFASARKSEFIDHKISRHNWCHICFSSFYLRLSLQNHIQKNHNDQGRLPGPQTVEDLTGYFFTPVKSNILCRTLNFHQILL